MAYACMVGAVWIGSRANAAFLVNSLDPDAIESAWKLYELRYENLLTVTRLAVLALSVIFVWLIVTGRSNYPKYMAVLNPIVLIVMSFLIYMVAPAIGKFLMLIALNVGFFILFTTSTLIARSLPHESENL